MTAKPIGMTRVNPNSRFKQGFYTPKHPEKYLGDIKKIRYMSSYELQMHSFLDNNVRVLKWSAEPVAIPYLKPTDGQIHRYYPDYFVEYVNTDGEIIQEIIEVKPFQQTHKPHGNKNRKSLLYEQVTYAINQAKWAACELWCKQRGYKFKLVTERKIFK